MKYLGQIKKGVVKILNVSTGKVFDSWDSAIDYEERVNKYLLYNSQN